ncbi:hypothetical protein FA04_13895 [Ensifer adhaerens]|uniref:Terminase small subunit n=1 Tax=Ensifer adhaerens TaxID=106592 RepID=A0ABY8HC63_ENSAD|nr:hypothetical protein [Ensifer adhaerens]ANK73616.1 hypothetical protein FA04_13895 [Ensifer adhaerens]KDP73642.1 hypothetical protein FA04_11095 [Ensifer adhaerens]WFP89691.1 hypothetical protein P4B07_14120 [Ensifer adhaerens]
MSLSADTMTKGAFAAHIGVSAGRISQYIAEGKIYGDALEGEGRAAKIRPAVAQSQLQKTLEPSQRFGANGQASLNMPTRQPALNLGGRPPRPAAVPPSFDPDEPELIVRDDVADKLAAERLRQQQIKTAQLEREEALEVGRYMLADDARRQTVKAVTEAFKVMELAIPAMAKTMAAQFDVPMHDAMHALLKSFREARAKAAKDFATSAAELAEHVEDEQT